MLQANKESAVRLNVVPLNVVAPFLTFWKSFALKVTDIESFFAMKDFLFFVKKLIRKLSRVYAISLLVIIPY